MESKYDLMALMSYLPYLPAAYLCACVAFRASSMESIVKGELVAVGVAVAGLAWLGHLVHIGGGAPTTVEAAALAGASLLGLVGVWRHQIRGPSPGAPVDLSDAVVIVTGSNSGIGVETARRIAALPGAPTVVMACRTEATALAACESIRRSTGNARVSVMPLDLGDFASVRAFAEQFSAAHDRCDVLVNNAGVMLPSRKLTGDGVEMTLQVNCMGVYLLVLSLLPLLRKSRLPGGARVTLVSSSLHKLALLTSGGFSFDDFNREADYSMFAAYGQSKLGLELFKHELNRQLRTGGEAMQVNSLMPGTIPTAITRHLPFLMQLGQFFCISFVNKTAHSGSSTTVHVATSEAATSVSGKWFEHCGVRPQRKGATDPAAARRLWELAAELTKFDPATVGLQ